MMHTAACLLAVALASVLAGCGKLEGFGGEAPPLVTFHVELTGELEPLLPQGEAEARSLQLALVWAAPWVTEPFCVLPPESEPAARVIAAGCRDPFAFVPERVVASVPATVGTIVDLPLFQLPAADVMVGDVTSRVAYGTLVVYDDRDASGTLELARPRRIGRDDDDRGPPEVEMRDSPDIVYGASFFTMTEPDQRVAFSEGTFIPSAFYPREGCAPPASGEFSILGAGGFSVSDGLASAAAGRLPPMDPATCSNGPPDTLVRVAVRDPAVVQEVACEQRVEDSSTRYREPPDEAPDLTGLISACARLPSFEVGEQSSLVQLVVATPAENRCKGLTHFTLRGCRRNVDCAVPDWDFTATPPAWWPCSQ